MKSFALHVQDDSAGEWRQVAAPREVEYPDYCSRDGAANLKAKIEAYWRDRGMDVALSLHNVGFHPAIRAARYDLRSDMVNGMPQGTKAKKPAPVPASDPFLDDEDDFLID